MTTAIPLENLNASTRPGGAELEIDEMELASLAIDQMPEEQMDDLIPNRTSAIWQKWIHHVVSWVMLFSSFAVIIAGMTSRQENGWGFAFIV